MVPMACSPPDSAAAKTKPTCAPDTAPNAESQTWAMNCRSIMLAAARRGSFTFTPRARRLASADAMSVSRDLKNWSRAASTRVR